MPSYEISKAEMISSDNVEVLQQTASQHVDVCSAEQNFAALCRQLSEASLHHLAHNQTDGRVRDKESQDHHGDKLFDLLSYLRGTTEERKDLGFFHKELGVVFDKLSVTGTGGIKLEIRTFSFVLKQLLLSPIISHLKRRFAPETKRILYPMSGFLKPGQMCLVLGRPGSGCTTFLKVIANQRMGYMKIEGEVLYSGISADVMAEQFKGECVYNPEDDYHHPTLTVAQTIRFALSTKTPTRRLPGETKKIFIEKVMHVFLQMLGITHTKNTLVGDSVMRGVSGGERKRVSIAEMLATRACVLSWDNSTRGLDANTALEYAKSLRILTNVLSTTMFVTLYQAGEGIYNQFDKVMLLNEGRMVYFGPANEARSYMIGLGYKDLPRQTTADYLTGCTDSTNQRQFEEGFAVDLIPKTPEEMERAYLESTTFIRMNLEMLDYKKSCIRERRDQLEFIAAVKEDKSTNSGSKSPYTVSIFSQVKALIIRQVQLMLQDRLGRVFEWGSTMTLSFVVGSLFYDLPNTSEGAFTREGILFVAMLFNVFIALIELPKQMMGRPILRRQANFCFYRPGSHAIANVIAEIPFSFPKIFVFTTIIYLLAGLYRGAGAFFTCFLLIYAGYFSLNVFFRLLGAISFSYDTASRMASAVVILMSLYCGYEIPQGTIPKGLRWVFRINPLSYTFSALMGNELGRLDLACDESWIVPRGKDYPAGVGPNQACRLPGSMPGQSSTAGEDYIRLVFGYSKHDVWRNVGIIFGYMVVFMSLLFVAVEKLTGSSQPSIHVFQKENSERKELNRKLQEKKKQRLNGSCTQDLSDMMHTRQPLTWEALTYDVPFAGGQKRLLNEIYGYVKPGTLTALMGSSGAGKTTLLDVLANRKTTGVVGGQICISGVTPGVEYQRKTAYCEQQDMHDWTSTVREAFRFSAYLRQPADVSIEEKNAYVEEIIHLLEMEDLADAMIGIPGYGLDVEARKRVTIGVELAAKPQLLLFLDEPTSGLDGQSAYNIVRFLRKLASAGQAILCTIHQPNALLFENFDRLLLLKKGGRCVYFGEIGRDSNVIRSYFERQGAHCPKDGNPAEFMLEAIGTGTRDWADLWLESTEHSENIREIQRLENESSAHQKDYPTRTKEMVYAASFWYQLKTVIRRTNISFYRNGDYEVTRLFNHFSVGLIVGLTFLDLGNGVSATRDRLFSIFQGMVIPILIVTQVQPVFFKAREIYNRESSSKMYSPTVFAMGQFVAETPYSFACATVYYVLWYFLNGFQRETNRAGYAFLMILLIELYSVTVGQAIAALSPSEFIAQQANPAVLVTVLLFSGVPRSHTQFPIFWRDWIYNINPMTRYVSGSLANALHELPIQCREEEFVLFLPPAGNSCFEWAGSFVNATSGYLKDPENRDMCQYCLYKVGDEYLNSFGVTYETRWRDLGIFSVYVVANVIATVLGATFLTARYAKR
ncbi:hypothetical protein CROQUDRAFT_174085 [Cronartium quercuum f. sp. fusiforme G11]|uniref:ABC transporter domain-containing protein n=1 Tax=Cronartium quercuum f. sp. fusiforme G11 TaxID=708437 RepID=A0A9P6T8W3_9BASI|nr:hypothetical protein CROQUDRAFT_174085 [Cronartium quercuum f. sp. fusiforme G11]